MPTRPHVVLLACEHATPMYGSRLKPRPSENAVSNAAIAAIPRNYATGAVEGPASSLRTGTGDTLALRVKVFLCSLLRS